MSLLDEELKGISNPQNSNVGNTAKPLDVVAERQTKSVENNAINSPEINNDKRTERETMDVETFLKKIEEVGLFGNWFPTEKKIYTIEAKFPSQTESFSNDLEVMSYKVGPEDNKLILKGVVGELWPNKIEKVLKVYTHEDGSPLTIDDFRNAQDEFIKIKTVPSSGKYFAFQVPLDMEVYRNYSNGEKMYANYKGHPDAMHGNGDFLICEANERGEPDTSHVWVVNGNVFPKTYNTDNLKQNLTGSFKDYNSLFQ